MHSRAASLGCWTNNSYKYLPKPLVNHSIFEQRVFFCQAATEKFQITIFNIENQISKMSYHEKFQIEPKKVSFRHTKQSHDVRNIGEVSLFAISSSCWTCPRCAIGRRWRWIRGSPRARGGDLLWCRESRRCRNATCFLWWRKTCHWWRRWWCLLFFVWQLPRLPRHWTLLPWFWQGPWQRHPPNLHW